MPAEIKYIYFMFSPEPKRESQMKRESQRVGGIVFFPGLRGVGVILLSDLLKI